jgi:hypothetical protein
MRIYGTALAALALSAACGGQREAQDPGDILGEWGSHQGVDGRTGKPAQPAQPTARLATETECRAAVRRLELLALDTVVAEAPDAEERARRAQAKQAELASEGFKQRVDSATRDCLERETRQREALCIARVRSEEDIARCPR